MILPQLSVTQATSTAVVPSGGDASGVATTRRAVGDGLGNPVVGAGEREGQDEGHAAKGGAVGTPVGRGV